MKRSPPALILRALRIGKWGRRSDPRHGPRPLPAAWPLRCRVQRAAAPVS
jgi:hypothetical protein